jgi:prepilin-type N-terminal cleavage/methylation domain-containing protein
MENKINRGTGQNGVSVAELLVVLAITAILVAFAVAQYGNASDIF